MHQTCTNNLSQQPVQTTYHNKQVVSSILSTKSDLLTKINHQDNSQRCASTKHNTTTHNHHQDQYVLLIIYQYKYATSSINHVSTILLTSASNHVPSMYQSCINYSSTMTHQDVPTSSTIHLMYVPTHQLLVSTMYPTCTSTKSPHQFHHPNMICNSVIDLVYMITYLQTFLNFNNKRLTFSSNFTLVSHD
jgi:small-conductance mechanosensitive channel